jgi:hypothetical protein
MNDDTEYQYGELDELPRQIGEELYNQEQYC